jgi:hypothetical protein
MCVSIDVAEVVVSVPSSHLPTYQLHYQGAAELKGVHSGRPYPIFWLDCDPEDGFAKAEDVLLGRVHAKTDDIVDLAKCSIELAGGFHIWLPDALNPRFTLSGAKIKELNDQIVNHCDEFPEIPADESAGPTESDSPAPSVEPNLTAKLSELNRNPGPRIEPKLD